MQRTLPHALAYPAYLSFNRSNPTCNKSTAFSTGRLFYPVSCPNSIFGYGLVSNQTHFSFSLMRELNFLLCPGWVECATNTQAVVPWTSHGANFSHKCRMHTHCSTTMLTNAPACLCQSCDHIVISSTSVNARAILKAFRLPGTP